MKFTAAIPVKSVEEAEKRPKGLTAYGFDETILLWTAEERPPAIEGDAGEFRIVRTNPAFIVEAAIAEASRDWVFVLYPGDELTGGALTPTGGASCCCFGDGEPRGFSRSRLSTGGVCRVEAPKLLSTRSLEVELAKPRAWPEAKFALTVILPTWRLGGLDVTLGALAKQSFTDFEVVLVDALHQWRSVPHIKSMFGEMPFRVVHCTPDNDIFPVSSHSRFRNTAIRRARGRRLVFMSDYAAPPSDFLERHAAVPDTHVGLTTWVRTKIDPDTVLCQGLSVWDVVEQASRPAYLWSTFRYGVDALADAVKYERANTLRPQRFPENPAANVHLGTVEYLPHWKSDSVTTEAARKINGWDESFDGRGDYADVDFSLRLLWSGQQVRILEGECRILDAHDISVAPISDWTRDNWVRLQRTRENRLIRCLHGLERGVHKD